MTTFTATKLPVECECHFSSNSGDLINLPNVFNDSFDSHCSFIHSWEENSDWWSMQRDHRWISQSSNSTSMWITFVGWSTTTNRKAKWWSYGEKIVSPFSNRLVWLLSLLNIDEIVSSSKDSKSDFTSLSFLLSHWERNPDL